MRRLSSLAVLIVTLLVTFTVGVAGSRTVVAQPAKALNWGTITVSPSHPNVDTQTLSVSFKAPLALKAGWKYSGTLIVLSNGETGCASDETNNAQNPKQIGKLVRLTFRPQKSAQAIGDPALSKWCQASATLVITVLNGKKTVAVTEAPDFRFAP